jgi:Cys-tRNA(Pro)/Cys-tRNA(Cys) deacylase
VKDYETVVIGSGVLGFALSLKGADLLRLFGDADMGSFTSSER